MGEKWDISSINLWIYYDIPSNKTMILVKVRNLSPHEPKMAVEHETLCIPDSSTGRYKGSAFRVVHHLPTYLPFTKGYYSEDHPVW